LGNSGTRRIYCCDRISPDIRHTDSETRLSKRALQKERETSNLPRRGSCSSGAGMGDLWADLFKAASSILTGRCQDPGTMSRTESLSRNKAAALENEPINHRSLSKTSTIQITTAWIEHHQARLVTQKGHSRTYFFRVGGGQARIHGNRSGSTLWRYC